jgi:DNA recombination protein RmuC
MYIYLCIIPVLIIVPLAIFVILMRQMLSKFLINQQTQQEQLTQANLMNLFRVPKLRGLQGEKWLEALLKEVLPSDHFSIQYTFSTGVICDAVIFLHNGKKLSIDSKFSMENFLKIMNASNENESKEFEKEFHKNIKCHINEISKKYILPAEGTLDFAFMYVPAEGIYYQTFVKNENDLLDYAFKQNVMVTSPNTLYIYLQFMLHGLKGYAIEQNARQFQQGLAGIMKDLQFFSDEHGKLKEKLDQAQKNFAISSKFFDRAQTGLKNLIDLSITDNKNIN